MTHHSNCFTSRAVNSLLMSLLWSLVLLTLESVENKIFQSAVQIRAGSIGPDFWMKNSSKQVLCSKGPALCLSDVPCVQIVHYTLS